MSRVAIAGLAVVIGVLFSILVETTLASVMPSWRTSLLLHWAGNVVSIVMALLVYNLASTRRAR